jgi:hypothetical protein
VNDLVVGVPGPTPGGTTFLLVVEPVRVVASGSIEVDLERAASDLGPWSPSADELRREELHGWSFLFGSGDVALEGAVCPALTCVARRNALRARCWAVADSEDTRGRYLPAVNAAMTSVRHFVESAIATPV